MQNPNTSFRRFLPPLATAFIAVAMVAGILRVAYFANAQDQVCGDSVVDAPEQCDDGNLTSGDGCSNSCSLEVCGNATTDVDEQCDDGNEAAGDGCNQYCQMEFCGDLEVQPGIGEECDDGNGIAGDGCTGDCRLESAVPNATVNAAPDPAAEAGLDSPASSQFNPPAAPATQQNQVSPATIFQAQQGAEFLESPAGEDYTQHLTREESLQLETILTKLSSGRRLNREERSWAQVLVTRLEQAKFDEAKRYTDLLKQFISTPVSTEVVEEKNLEKSRLVDVEVSTAINELDRAVDVLRSGQVGDEVQRNVAKLERQGIDIEADSPTDYRQYLQPGTRPIEVFATLKVMKEATEKYATTDVPASLAIIRAEAKSLIAALPAFQREYGVDTSDIGSLLTSIDTLSSQVDKKDVERVVNAINRLLQNLERKDVISPVDLAMLDERNVHAAARVEILLEQTGREPNVTPSEMIAVVYGIAENAPAPLKSIFEKGDDMQQRVMLLKFLDANTRLHELRSTLRADGQTAFDDEYKKLREAIGNVGTGDAETGCDDSMPAALRCTNDYLTDLELAARNRSFTSRFIGTLQDYFGIGSNE